METKQNYRKKQIRLTKKRFQSCLKDFCTCHHMDVSALYSVVWQTPTSCVLGVQHGAAPTDRQRPTVIKWLTYDHALYQDVVSETELNKPKRDCCSHPEEWKKDWLGDLFFFLRRCSRNKLRHSQWKDTHWLEVKRISSSAVSQLRRTAHISSEI